MTEEERRRQLRLKQLQARQAAAVGGGVASATPVVPEGFFINPETGQMTSRELLRNNVTPSRGEAIAGGAMQGLGLGLGDELIGTMGRIEGGEDMANFRREQARASLEANQEAFPWSYGAGQVGGAVGTSLASMGAAGVGAGAGLMGNMGRGAAVGAGEGALWGFGEGEGLEGRVDEAQRGAATGAIVGGAAPAVAAGGAKALGAARDILGGGLDNLIGRSSQGRANRALMEVVDRSGKSVDDLGQEVAQAQLEGQPEFRLMDALGLSGQRRASGITRQGGEGAEDMARFLRQRQVDQGDRMGGFVEDAFGFRGQSGNLPAVPGQAAPQTPGAVLSGPQRSAADTTSRLRGARGASANRAYDAARANAGPVDVRGAISAIDSRIGPMEGSGVSGDGIDALLSRFRNRLAARNPTAPNSAVELSDFDRVLGVKQDLQDAIGVASRAGRNNEARELGKVLSQLDQALEVASPDYRAANSAFARDSRVIEAVDEGRGMATRGRARDNLGRFRAMSPEEQKAARIGYGDAVSESMERNKAAAPNVAREFASTKRQQEAGGMALDPDLLARRVERENAMYEGYQRALGGSRTADNLEDIRDLGPTANAGRALRELLSGNLGNAASNAGAALSPLLSGQSEGTRSLIAKMLMSDDPQKALAKAVRNNQVNQATRSVIEALMRQGGREPAETAMFPR